MPRLRITLLAGTFTTTLALVAVAPRSSPAQQPLRGDVNSDKKIDIGDPIFLLKYIFAGGTAPQCAPAADTNADAQADISDAITLLFYLFAAQVVLPPLTSDEVARCESGPPTVIRHGSLKEVSDPGHGVDGQVEQLSSGSIRIESFNYDGTGLPQVVVLLTRSSGFDNVGFVISPDLVRDHPYVNETLEFPIPLDATNDDFKFVSIWCDKLPLTYAFAQLVDGP